MDQCFLLSSLPAKIQVLQLGIHGKLAGVDRGDVIFPENIGLCESNYGILKYGKEKYGIIAWCKGNYGFEIQIVSV